MSDSMFEEIQRFQLSLEKALKPYKQAQMMFKANLSPVVEQMNAIRKAFEPTQRFLEQHREMIRKTMIPNELIQTQLRPLQEALALVYKMPATNLPIPDEVILKVDKLIDTFNETVPEDIEIIEKNEVKEIVNSHQNAPWTWETLKIFLQILIAVLQIYFTLSSSIEAERYHQETLEQNERHHQEEMEQRERHHQESLEQNERHHREKMLLLCQELLTACEPYCQNDQNLGETDQASSEMPQTKRSDED
jgi:hypothetical protein